MRITRAQIQESVQKARQIYDVYKLAHLNSDATVRSVDDLRATIATDMELTINVLLIEHDTEIVRGTFVKTGEKTVDILVLAKLNYCWRRFVQCKELFHVLLDDEKYRNMDVAEHVNEMMLSFPQPDYSPSLPLVTEMMAELAAIEFLFPHAQRLFELSKGDPVSFLDIAEKYKVPRVFVEKYLSATYMSALAV